MRFTGNAFFDRLQGVSIVGFIGANGSGKSLAAVELARRALDGGRVVAATVRLTTPGTTCNDETCSWPDHPYHGQAHPLWRPVLSWGDLLDLEHCDVVLDEVTGVASSRESSSLPTPAADWLVQLRRRDIRLRWTSPAWARADLLLRECTQAAVLSKGFRPRPVHGQSWRANTWTYLRAGDARSLDSADMAVFADSRGRRSVNAKWRPDYRAFVRIPDLPAIDYYDTLSPVSSFSTISYRGSCLTCGGTVRRVYCSCHE